MKTKTQNTQETHMPQDNNQPTAQTISPEQLQDTSAQESNIMSTTVNKAPKSRYHQYSRKVLEARAERKKQVETQEREKRKFAKQDDKLFNTYKLRGKGLTYPQIAKILGISEGTVKNNLKELGGICLKSFQENEAQIYDFIRARMESVLLRLSDRDFEKLVTGKSGAIWFNSHFNNSQLLKGKPTASIAGVTVLSFKDWKRPDKKPVQVNDLAQQLPGKADGVNTLYR